MREATITRNTKETQITMSLCLDCKGAGMFSGTTGIGFFDHMLNSFCVHGGFKIKLDMTGDIHVDGHHTAEDTGIVLGKLFGQILGDRSGIARFGESYVPMDESLAFAAVDICGRPFLVYREETPVTAPSIGSYDTQLTREFFRALAFNMGATLHIRLLYGDNAHHMTEAMYKAAARAIGTAVGVSTGVLSAKGVLA